MVCFNAEIMVKEMLLTLVKHCWTQLHYYCTLNCCTKVFVKADAFPLFYNPSLKDDWYFLLSNAQFPVLIYLDQTLIDKHTDVPLQSCLELEAQQFCAFWEAFVLALEKPVSVEEILERCLEQHQASTFVYLNLWLERSSQEWNDHYKCTYLDSVVTAHNITSCIITWYTT